MPETGRGDGRVYRPSKTPRVTIGIKLSTSPPALDATSTEPFYLVVTAHILDTPHPSSPVTLATHQNLFCPLPNRSFQDSFCVGASSSTGKKIETAQKYIVHYHFRAEDLKDDWEFVTIPAAKSTLDSSETKETELVIKHEIPQHLISKAEVKKGERYRVSFTNKFLGTRWWMFGDMEDEWVKDTRFVHYADAPAGGDTDKGTDDKGKWCRGEPSEDLALIIEGDDGGAVEFEIV